MPPQWKRGYKVTWPPERVLVIGPWDYDDQEEMNWFLDDFTLRLQNIQVVLTGTGTRIEQNGDWHYLGVDYCASKWAEKYWWDRIICKRILYRDEGEWIDDVVEQLFNDQVFSYCFCMYDENDITHDDLIDAVREMILPTNFKMVKV